MTAKTPTRICYADVGALEESALFQKLYERTSGRRREKIDFLRFDKDKRLSLGADALLRFALAELGLDPDEPIAEEPGGKPYLLKRPDVRFNLSHSGSQALCAVSANEIGCDVDAIDDVELSVAERVLHPEELARLMALEDAARWRYFCRLWTLKESFMKATGLGLALEPNDFAILIDGATITVDQRVDARSYSFREYDLSDRYCRACCVQNGSPPEELIRVDLSELK